MNSVQISKSKAADEICQKCGLCCNGVIFADVKLRPGERLAVAKALGTLSAALSSAGGVAMADSPAAPASCACKTLVQPCAAFDGRWCRIYGERPEYCRQFECALLKRVKAGQLAAESALGIIRSARKRTGTARWLIQLMGDSDESAPLAARFRRVSALAEKSGLQGQSAAVFANLTNAMHELNHLLARTFYPGE